MLRCSPRGSAADLPGVICSVWAVQHSSCKAAKCGGFRLHFRVTLPSRVHGMKDLGATDHGSQARSSRLGAGTWEGRVFEFSSFFLAFSPLVSGQETKGKLKTLNGWLRMFRREPSSCLFGAHRSASGQCWCVRLSSPAAFSWGTKVPPVLRLGESPAKIHCWLQPWPVLCHVARVQLGPTGRKRGHGWDGAGQGMDAAGGAAACPQGAEGDRGAAMGC